MVELKILLAALYQQYLDKLGRGYNIVYDWVEHFKHIVYLLESGKLKHNEYDSLLGKSIAQVNKLLDWELERTIVFATSGGIVTTTVPNSGLTEIEFWTLPLNTNERFTFTSSNLAVFGIEYNKIITRSPGTSTLTIKGKNITLTQIITVT